MGGSLTRRKQVKKWLNGKQEANNEREKYMNRTAYEQTKDYKKSLQIVRDFVNEVLGGDIEKFKAFCFGDLAKYIGKVDPNMFLITQASYIILWGDIYDLNFEKMSEKRGNKYPFRGVTMNSFGSVIGKEDDVNSFAFRAKFFGADKNQQLWEKINEFYKIYHYLGNFIVIANRGDINWTKGSYEGMRDYFDWFLIAISKYQEKVMRGIDISGEFEKQLQMNPEYHPSFLKIEEWEKRFFLKHYFKSGKPILLFKTPLEERLKTTTAPENRNRKDIDYYGDEEYLELLEDYLDKSKEVIEYRTKEIVQFLKNKLSE